MKKTLAFMSELGDITTLERDEETGNITLTFDTSKTSEFCIVNGESSINISNIEEIIYCQENDSYNIVYDSGYADMICINLKSKDSFLYITSDFKEDDYNHISVNIEVRNCNIFDDYPKYRSEIKDGMINTYFIPAPCVQEQVLLNTKFSIENIINHQNIQTKMCDTIKEIYKDYYNNEDNREFYIYYKDMVYKLDGFVVNVMNVSTVDVFDNSETSKHIVIPYEDFVNNNGFMFDSTTSFVYHNSVIKNGHCIGWIDKHEFEPLIKPITNEDFEESLIITTTKVLSDIVNITGMIGNEQYELMDILELKLKSLKAIVKSVNDSCIMDKFGMANVCLYYRGIVYLYHKDAIDSFITFTEEYIEKMKDIIKKNKDKIFDETLGLDQLQVESDKE